MSFGFSIGDFILLSGLAWETVQNARDACGIHDDLTREVTSLHVVLQRLQREVARPQSILNSNDDDDDDRKEELAILAQHCEQVLQVLSKILQKYNALSDEKRSITKFWKTVKFGNGEMQDLSKIRIELSTHTNAITMFLNLLSVGSQGKVEQHMVSHGEELRAMRSSVNWITASLQATSGNREGSILTSYADDDKAFWKELRRELVKEGYSSTLLRKYKTVIREYVKELGDRGALDELVVETEETSVGDGSPSTRIDSPELNQPVKVVVPTSEFQTLSRQEKPEELDLVPVALSVDHPDSPTEFRKTSEMPFNSSSTTSLERKGGETTQVSEGSTPDGPKSMQDQSDSSDTGSLSDKAPQNAIANDISEIQEASFTEVQMPGSCQDSSISATMNSGTPNLLSVDGTEGEDLVKDEQPSPDLVHDLEAEESDDSSASSSQSSNSTYETDAEAWGPTRTPRPYSGPVQGGEQHASIRTPRPYFIHGGEQYLSPPPPQAGLSTAKANNFEDQSSMPGQSNTGGRPGNRGRSDNAKGKNKRRGKHRKSLLSGFFSKKVSEKKPPAKNLPEKHPEKHPETPLKTPPKNSSKSPPTRVAQPETTAKTPTSLPQHQPTQFHPIKFGSEVLSDNNLPKSVPQNSQPIFQPFNFVFLPTSGSNPTQNSQPQFQPSGFQRTSGNSQPQSSQPRFQSSNIIFQPTSGSNQPWNSQPLFQPSNFGFQSNLGTNSPPNQAQNLSPLFQPFMSNFNSATPDFFAQSLPQTSPGVRPANFRFEPALGGNPTQNQTQNSPQLFQPFMSNIGTATGNRPLQSPPSSSPLPPQPFNFGFQSGLSNPAQNQAQNLPSQGLPFTSGLGAASPKNRTVSGYPSTGSGISADELFAEFCRLTAQGSSNRGRPS